MTNERNGSGADFAREESYIHKIQKNIGKINTTYFHNSFKINPKYIKKGVAGPETYIKPLSTIKN